MSLSSYRLNAQAAVTDMARAEEFYEGVLESGFDYGTDERGISPRAGGGKVAWFKDPDGNIFSIESDR